MWVKMLQPGYKNNIPQAIIILIDVYNKLVQVQEGYELLQFMLKRSDNSKHENYLAFEDVVNKAGFSLGEIDKLAESVEIE